MSTTVITAGSVAGPSMFAVALAMQTLVQYLIYLGAIFLVSIIGAVWFVSTRRPLQHSDHHHRHRHSSRGWFGLRSGKADGSELSGKKRRRRRSHRKRNPTLAETGGLPPIRGQTSSSADEPEL